MIDVAVEGLVQSEDELRHGARPPPQGFQISLGQRDLEATSGGRMRAALWVWRITRRPFLHPEPKFGMSDCRPVPSVRFAPLGWGRLRHDTAHIPLYAAEMRSQRRSRITHARSRCWLSWSLCVRNAGIGRWLGGFRRRGNQAAGERSGISSKVLASFPSGPEVLRRGSASRTLCWLSCLGRPPD
jgi:hypothetical protein